jgi:hypothetical protein
MVIPFFVSLAWILARYTHPQSHYPFGIEPIYVGLSASLFVYAAGLSLRGGLRS